MAPDSAPERRDPAVPLLAVDDLRVSVEGSEILRGVTLEIAPGEVHALMGPNGAGKSTLANVLLGHPGYRVTGGAIRLNGEDVTSGPAEARAEEGPFLARER